MAERPNLSKSGNTTPPANGGKPAPPRLVVLAVAALLLSGVAAVLASATLYTGSVKVWVRDGARDTLSDQMKDKFDDLKKELPGAQRATQLTELRNEINKIEPTASDRLTPIALEIKRDIAGLETGASKKAKGLLDDLDKQANSVRDITDQIGTQQKGALISSIVVFSAPSTGRGRRPRRQRRAR